MQHPRFQKKNAKQQISEADRGKAGKQLRGDFLLKAKMINEKKRERHNGEFFREQSQRITKNRGRPQRGRPPFKRKDIENQREKNKKCRKRVGESGNIRDGLGMNRMADEKK